MSNQGKKPISSEGKKPISTEAGRAFVRALIKTHIDKYEATEDEISDRCFKCLIGEHDSDDDDDDEGYIFKLIKVHEPKTADSKQKTNEKLNTIIKELKKFVYRVKRRYKCDVIEKGFKSYEKYKGKNEPIFSIHGEYGEKMELLRVDYYKQLTEGYEANKQQIKDLRTAKALLTAEQKEHRRLTGELKQAQQTINQLRENNRELKSKYKALLNQKTKEKQPAPRISNPSDIIHSDNDEEHDEEADEEADEEHDEGQDEKQDEEESNEEHDEESDEQDEGQDEGQDEEEHRDEGRPEGDNLRPVNLQLVGDRDNNEGKQAIIEGEPDPPYLDEAEPGLFAPYIQRDGQHITQDGKNNKSDHYII